MSDKKVAPLYVTPDLSHSPKYGDVVFVYGQRYLIGTIDKDGQDNLQITLYKEGQLPSRDQLIKSDRRIVPNALA